MPETKPEQIPLYESLRKSQIPEHMHGAIIRYLEDGIHPGDFLSAVLNNDLKEACVRADDINRSYIFEYVRWLYNFAPRNSWGYDGAVDEWGKGFRSSE